MTQINGKRKCNYCNNEATTIAPFGMDASDAWCDNCDTPEKKLYKNSSSINNANNGGENNDTNKI
jgi:hypothetical protein